MKSTALSLLFLSGSGLLLTSQAFVVTPPPPILHQYSGIPSTVIERLQVAAPQIGNQQAPTTLEYITTWLLAPDTPQLQQPLLAAETPAQDPVALPPLKVASHEQVEKILRNPKTVLLDARRDDEIVDNGFISIKGHRWVHASCTKDNCPLLIKTAESQLPDKNAPVIVYCATGKRAAQAEKTLESKGYKSVLNAGAYPDLDYLKNRS